MSIAKGDPLILANNNGSLSLSLLTELGLMFALAYLGNDTVVRFNTPVPQDLKAVFMGI